MIFLISSVAIGLTLLFLEAKDSKLNLAASFSFFVCIMVLSEINASGGYTPSLRVYIYGAITLAVPIIMLCSMAMFLNKLDLGWSKWLYMGLSSLIIGVIYSILLVVLVCFFAQACS